MGEPEDLLELRGDQEHAEAVGGEARDEVVDRALRADVDAARRLVGDQHARAAQERPREQHLLLVAARERPHRRASSGAPRTSQRSRTVRAVVRSAPRRTTPNALTSVEPREGRVLDHGAPEDQAVVLARLGDHREARARGCGAGCAPSGAAARELDRAGLHARRAEERAGELGAARADEPGERRGSRRRAGRTRRRRRREPRARAPRARTGASAGGSCLGGKVDGQRPARASPRSATTRVSCAAGDVRTSAPSRSTVTVSASSSTSRRKCEIRRIDVPRARERADDLVQLLRLVPAQRRRRLVHDDQLGVARERAQDLDLLLLGRAQPARPTCRPGGRTRPSPRARRRPRRSAAPRRNPPRARLAAEQHVLGDRQLRDDATAPGRSPRRPRSSASRGERNETASPSSRTRPASRRDLTGDDRARASTCPRRSRRRARGPTRARRSARRPASAWTPPKCLATSRSSR